jgi:integrase
MRGAVYKRGSTWTWHVDIDPRPCPRDRLDALWLLVATTGMRRGELAGLRWVDIDFDHATVSPTIPRVVVDHQVHDSAPKTERTRRRLALDPVTLAALQAQCQLQAEDRQTVGGRYREHGYVFTWPDGRPPTPRKHRQLVRATHQGRRATADLPA